MKEIYKAIEKARLQIRKSTHRNQDGFLVVGTDTKNRKVSIFIKTKSDAEKVKQNILKDKEPFESNGV